MELRQYRWHRLTLQSDVIHIERGNGMSVAKMMDIVSRWKLGGCVLRVFDIQFKDGLPHSFRAVGFTDWCCRSKDEFIEFMANVSLTHKVMFVENNGGVFITESDDGQTNIDADLIDAMLNAYN